MTGRPGTADRVRLGECLLLATHTAGKLAELRSLLAPRGIEVIGAAERGLAEPEETETTFAGNALIKAQAAVAATGLPALADDSGLVVDALGGEPGVLSARWAGPQRDFSAAMDRVLEALATRRRHTPGERRAAFVTVLALARPHAAPALFEGRVDGYIADAPRGSEGFGYDPIFVPQAGDGRTFGEMSAAQKAGQGSPLSHRARAVAAFLAALA